MRTKTPLIILASFVAFCLVMGIAFAAEPAPALAIQGLLKTPAGDPVADSSYSVTYNIYNTQTGGSPVYTKTITNVQTKNGIFSVLLNDVSLPFGEQYWLGIKVGTDTEMTPRSQLTYAAYSFSTDRLLPTNYPVNVNLTSSPGTGAAGLKVGVPSGTDTFGTYGINVYWPDGYGIYSRSAGSMSNASILGEGWKVGVNGTSFGTTSGAVGIYGQAPSNGWAGYFRGRGYFTDTLETGGEISNIEDSPGYATTRLKTWGLLSSGRIYIEPGPGSTFYIVPNDWSQNMNTTIYGKVGIGTASPESTLNIAGSTGGDALGFGTGNYKYTYFGSAASSANAFIGHGVRSNTTSGYVRSTGYWGNPFATSLLEVGQDIVFSTRAAEVATEGSAWVVADNTKMIIKNNGNVGIGTSSPAYDLDVSGDVRWSGTLQGGSVPWARLSSFPSACPSGQYVTAVGSALTCAAPGAGVTSFNTRTGVVTLGSSDVTTALGYTPVNKAGDTMSGTLNLNSNKITNLATPTSTNDAATKGYVDTSVAAHGMTYVGRHTTANYYVPSGNAGSQYVTDLSGSGWYILSCTIQLRDGDTVQEAIVGAEIFDKADPVNMDYYQSTSVTYWYKNYNGPTLTVTAPISSSGGSVYVSYLNIDSVAQNFGARCDVWKY